MRELLEKLLLLLESLGEIMHDSGVVLRWLQEIVFRVKALNAFLIRQSAMGHQHQIFGPMFCFLHERILY